MARIAFIDGLVQPRVGSGLVAVHELQVDNVIPASCGSPVFTAGPAGFSGRLTPAACLADNSAPVAAGANTIVTAAGLATLEVFAEPSAGWSGTVAPAAQLQTSDGVNLSSVSMSGTTIAAVGQGEGVKAVYIFTEPAGGWSGVIHETARITFPDFLRAATLSGTTLVALGAGDLIDPHENVVRTPVFVLRRPAAGWQTLSASQARAFVQTGPGQDPDFGLDPASLLGRTTAFTNSMVCGEVGAPPCVTTIWAVNGLTSAVAAPKQLPVSPSSGEIDADGTPLASDGTTLALGADGVRLSTIAHTTPARVSDATLTGLTGPKPRPALRLTVIAGKGAAALASVRVLVPAQLGGADHAQTIAIKPSKRTATVTLRRLHPTTALRRGVGRIAAHGGHTTVTLPVELVDNTNHSSDSQVTLTITR
jgi:hypothetical protein